ncbi:ImmA/IrrE family metallo-endopeptidase [Frisingicoccus sp.]|uniref:ImmA/IrrE family metallo-endopeptidase n=1 Tax=Frisingicoccus sp. TaxID=1918627 RepID=UPI00386C276D
MTYEELQYQYDDLNIVEMDLSEVNGLKGLYVQNNIAIEKSMNQTEKLCVLAEELGHHETTVGNILDQTSDNNRRQEHRARVWAYRKMILPEDLYQAFRSGCRNRYEIAECIGVTEEFLEDALAYLSTKYPDGYKDRIHHYTIQFIPNLNIVMMFE